MSETNLKLRQLSILGAIVEDYISTREPVGSKALLERHELGVSAATVRNDMAVLEEEGLITQPHTSAGRIPTDLGYRVYVDQVAQIKPLSELKKRAIKQFFDGANDFDDLLLRTVRLLSGLTRQVAVLQYPALTQAHVRHVELVPTQNHKLSVILITDQGRVDMKTISLAHSEPEEFYNRLKDKINRFGAGKSVTELLAELDLIKEMVVPKETEATGEILSALEQLLNGRRENKVISAGTANLARSVNYAADVEPILDLLEEQIIILRLLGQLHPGPGEVDILIGQELSQLSLNLSESAANSELAPSALAGSALVGTDYGEGVSSSRLAILGPRHMDYVTSISSVKAVAHYISRLIS